MASTQRERVAKRGPRATAVAASASIAATVALSLGGFAAVADPTPSSTAPTSPTTTPTSTATTPTSTTTSKPSVSTTESTESTSSSSPVSGAAQDNVGIQSGPKTSLQLSLPQGGPGTQVTITAAGYGLCIDPPAEVREVLVGSPVFSLQWGRTTVDNVSTTNEARDVVARYTVPDEGSASDYSVTVTVSCSFKLKADPRFGSTVDSKLDSKVDSNVEPKSKVVQNDATFTVVVPKKDPTLTLDTRAGHRGAQITASGADFACGPSESVLLFWDGTGAPLTEPQPQAFSVPFAVPDQTSIGGHAVVARCQGRSTITASKPFEVTETEPPVVTPPPTLAVRPTSGHPGDQMSITGERFVCTDHAGIVEVRWDDDTSLATPPVDATGHFETSVSVPLGADARGHTVNAACADKSVAMAAAFAVVAPDVPPPPVPAPAAAMALQPSSGHRGDQMRVAGEGFACANRTVELVWDDGKGLATTFVDASGDFATLVPVPTDAELRSHPVGARCSDASIALTAAFTVIAGPPPPPPPPPPQLWNWLIALTLVVAAVLAARHVYHRLHPRVRAVSRLGGPPLVTVHETPAHGESTYALRLETHSGARTLTVEEVNDGHTLTE
jgi:hypothetical protein